MTAHIKRLVQQLDGEAGESYDARAKLIWIGSDATGFSTTSNSPTAAHDAAIRREGR
ncbi:hypothetical protein [Streptomyces platensis]|uniref:hypothetical protein n=1 Tax=Streptomyces platensis TaxID=58346 RepID=UPI002E803C1A|nr:hypothetical protein [Streptomyces platensis]WUB80050.1 hypothetical protein OG424_13165 [Streptomyces platensis]